MVACIFGVEDVLVHYECRASGLRGVAHPDLSDGSVFPKNIIPIEQILSLGCYLLKQQYTLGEKKYMETVQDAMESTHTEL